MAPKRKALMAEMEPMAAAKPKPRRALQRRAAVERTLTEHYRNYSSKQLRVDEIEGDTLAGHLLRMKREAKARGGKVSSKALDELGAKFAGPNLSAQGVTVNKATDPLDPKLEQAVLAAQELNTAIRSRQPLIDYLRSRDQPLSQRECAGICRIIQGLNVAANSNCRDECWEILQELIRLDCAQNHADTMVAMKPLFDATLSFTFTSLRAKGMDHKAFWGAFSHVFRCYGGPLFTALEHDNVGAETLWEGIYIGYDCFC